MGFIWEQGSFVFGLLYKMDNYIIYNSSYRSTYIDFNKRFEDLKKVFSSKNLSNIYQILRDENIKVLAFYFDKNGITEFDATFYNAEEKLPSIRKSFVIERNLIDEFIKQGYANAYNLSSNELILTVN